jgi:DNA invertase Pin-like site-specific DNA recombinase
MNLPRAAGVLSARHARPRAAIYVRISQDRDDGAEGVDDQKWICRAYCDHHGYDVVAVYEDNDISATDGSVRPRFDAMLAAVARGEIDVIVVKQIWRLYRLLEDLETKLTPVLRRAKVEIRTVRSGDVDLVTADGRLRARLMGAVGQHDTELKSENVADAAARRARSGRFHGGGRRFGYEQREVRTKRVYPRGSAEPVTVTRSTGPLVLVPAEADAIRWAYHHLLSGGLLYGVYVEWDRRGLVGVKGGKMDPSTIRTILLNPMNGGRRYHKGEDLAPSEGPAIVDTDIWLGAVAILRDPTRKPGPGRPLGHLLSSIVYCAVCKKKMAASATTRKVPLYKCAARKTVDRPGNHTSRQRRLLDDAVESALLTYLRNNVDALRRPVSSRVDALAGVHQEAEIQRARLAAYQEQADTMDVADYAAATRKIRNRLAELEKQIVATVGRPATATLIGKDDVMAAWKALSTDDKRVVLKENIDRVDVSPLRRGSRNHDPMTGVDIAWREL